MVIRNVAQIVSLDKEQTKIELQNGSEVLLPDGCHTITVLDMKNPADAYELDIKIIFYNR
jgi:hypothetical protein